MISKTTLAVVAMLAIGATAWDNNPPIPGRHPGWAEGKGESMVEFEFFYDLMCSGCKAADPAF